jgi:hypothetical protein
MAVNRLGSTQPLPGLGKPVREFTFRHPGLTRWVNFLLACIFLIAAVILLVQGSLQTYYSYYHFGPAIVWKTVRLPLALTVVFLGMGIFFVVRTGSNWNKKVSLFQNGLIFFDHTGKHALRWDEIRCIRYQIAKTHPFLLLNHTSQQYILYKIDGQKMVLTDRLEKVDELANDIRQKIFPRLYSQISNEYLTGKTILFGPLTLSYSKGLSFREQNLPWINVESGCVNHGILTISYKLNGKQKNTNFPTYRIPNLDVLLAVFSFMGVPGFIQDNKSSSAGGQPGQYIEPSHQGKHSEQSEHN